VAELVDALGSGSSGRKTVGVRVPLRPHWNGGTSFALSPQTPWGDSSPQRDFAATR
jgi:hypothetical protein